MRQRKPLLTRAECAALRGLAIAGIFLHNYCHWLGFAVKENEYTFTLAKCRSLASALGSPDINLPVHLLSFFGHYGVPVFLFLSAYGLVMKYESKDHSPSHDEGLWTFMRRHYTKLFDMMIVGFVAFTMVDAITPGPHKYHVTHIIGQLLMVTNLMPDPDHAIWPGPYWFFGLMVQLYLVYRVALHRRNSVWALALIALCWAAQVLCAPEGETLNRVRYNFIGGILPFCAGLLYARHGRQLTHGSLIVMTVLSGAAVFFFSFNFQLWLWAPLFVCTFAVGLVKLTPEAVCKGLAWLGSISAAIFVLHPITRKVFIPTSRHGDVYTGLLLYIVATVALAWFYHRTRQLYRQKNGNGTDGTKPQEK